MFFRKKLKDPFKGIQACLQKRDYEGALDWFETLLARDPQNTKVRIRFADTLVLAGNPVGAVEQLHMVADQLVEKGFIIRAIAISKRIFQIDPRQTDVHEKLAKMTEERLNLSQGGSHLEGVLTEPGEAVLQKIDKTDQFSTFPTERPEAFSELEVGVNMSVESRDSLPAVDSVTQAGEPDSEIIDSLREDIDLIIGDVNSSKLGEIERESEPPTHIPLFSDLTTQEFIEVALVLNCRLFKAGETVVREGDSGNSMFIVSTGEVRASVNRDGKQQLVARLRDGDFFGEMAVLSGKPRTATVIAVKNTEVLVLSRDNLQKICSRHPNVEEKIRIAYNERLANKNT